MIVKNRNMLSEDHIPNEEDVYISDEGGYICLSQIEQEEDLVNNVFIFSKADADALCDAIKRIAERTFTEGEEDDGYRTI